MDSECGRAPNSSPQADRSGMLISPPPEEVLRLAEGRAVRTSASGSSAVAPKRKRLPPTPVAIRDTQEQQTNITPNPRLRKQPKHVLGTSKIPNVQGETQNVATAISSHSGYRRRASTPIPPYDPPAEHFTPPREVVCTPPAGSRQKQRRKKRASSKPPMEEDDKSMVKNRGLHIKTEPPVIDLSAPPPPASPSDDPILLSGPPQRQSSRNPQTPSPSRRAHLVDFEMDLEIAGNDTVEINSSPERFTQPVFDFDNNMLSTWSDSDDDVAEEAEGEYTGKFTAFKVPIKADPPTSTTSRRMHQWGRPVSPHPLRPGSRRQSQGSPQPSSARLIDDDVFTDTEDGPYGSGVSLNERQMRVSHRNVERVDNTSDGHNFDDQHDTLNSADVVDTTGRRAHNPFDFHNIDTPTTSTFMTADIMLGPQETAVPFGDISEDTHFEEDISRTAAAQHPSPLPSDELIHEETEVDHDEENPEQALNRTDSLVPGDDDNDHHATLDTHREEMEADSDGSDDSGLEVPTEAGVVKIISNDPRAAARAAAILKQNDYDMIPHLALKRRRRQSIDSALRSIRRKDASDAGVSKSARKAKFDRRSTFGGVMGGKVYIPGSPAMTLPELLHEAELEVVSSPKKLVTTTRDDEGTPTLFSPEDDEESPTRDEQLPESAEREWTKKDWKALDQCFSDERLAVAVQQGAPEGTFADVHDVELGDVVRRYIETVGGERVVDGMGVEWTLDKLMHRTKALRKRQEIGKGAPPTPDALRLFCVSPTPSDMSVPHFTPTPADRRSRVPRSLGKGPLLPAPEPVTMFMTKPPLPPSLLAPRYSHLLEEALTVQNEGDRQRSASPVDSVDSAEESTDVGDTTPDRQSAIPVSAIPEPPTSAIKRSFNYITSWLRASPRPSKTPAKRPTHPALPIPPPEILEKPRGPVATPARKPLPRLSHPKELVTLQHAPLPPKPSQIPRVKEPPKRLVELNHIPMPPSEERPRLVSVKRKSSTGSVKDLVKNFEDMEKSVVAKGERSGVPAQLRKVKSVSSLGIGAERRAPAWRP